MKKLCASLIAIPLVACAQVPYHPQSYQSSVPPPPQSTAVGQLTKATVIEVQPLYEMVIVGKNCQPVQVYAPQPQPNAAGAIVGAVIGGAIGSRFGGGNGRLVATGVGSAAGAMVGANYPSYQQGYPQQMNCTPITTPRRTGNAYVADYHGIRYTGNTYSNIQVGDTVFVNVTTVINPGE